MQAQPRRNGSTLTELSSFIGEHIFRLRRARSTVMLMSICVFVLAARACMFIIYAAFSK